jgi:hypothetical protein
MMVGFVGLILQNDNVPDQPRLSLLAPAVFAAIRRASSARERLGNRAALACC